MLDFLMDKTDWEIYGMIRWRSNLVNIADWIDEIEQGNRITLAYADLLDAGSMHTMLSDIKPDYIFHLAAQSYPHTSFISPVDTLNTNILGVARLLEAVKMHCPEAIVHVCSSSEVFGRVPKEFVPIKEETPFHPASPYAISKAGTDLVGSYYAEAYGLRTMMTRMFTHTGPRRGDVFAESTFAKQIALIEADRVEPVVKVGNLDSMRTFADVRDAVRAYHMLVTVNPITGGVYNIGGAHSCTVGDMLETLLSYSTKKEIKVEVDPERLRPIDADLQVPDWSKFSSHTGWSPEIPFETTMRDLLEYWRVRVNRGERFLRR